MKLSIIKCRKIKDIIIICIAIMCIAQTLASSIKYAYATTSNYSILGTKSALGSPVLNTDFQSDDWNNWEMLTWGVYLSNFANPLIDDYYSAFTQDSSSGSKGAGLAALEFGSGSDPANSDTLKGLLNYAIKQQKEGGLKEIYVGYSPVNRRGITKNTPSLTSNIRNASFKDLFLMSSKNDGDSWVDQDSTTAVFNPTNHAVIVDGDYSKNVDIPSIINKSNNYISLATINDGSLPTFYVKYATGYESVFDYTDSWDAQLITALIARMACGNYKSKFSSTFNDMWSKATDLKLYLDTFGNIIVQYNGSRRVILPAASNQHLTSTPKINLATSLIMNSLTSNMSADDMTLQGQQSVSGLFRKNIWGSDIRFGGLPAFGSEIAGVSQGLIELYYDTDTIAYDNYFNGGSASSGSKTADLLSGDTGTVYGMDYGKVVQKLFNLDATKDTGNDYTLKIEAANMSSYNFSKISDSKASDALKAMLNASGQIANIAGKSNKAETLTKITTNNGEQSIFSNPVIVPVQMDVGKGSDGKINNAGVARLFMNYVYQTYTSGQTSSAGSVTQSYLKTLFSSGATNTIEKFRNVLLGIGDGTVSKLLACFVADNSSLFKTNVEADKIYGATLGNKSDPFTGMKDTQVNNKSAADILFSTDKSMHYLPGRLIKAYPKSEVMNSVGNVLGVRSGTEFSTYSTYLYLTYLNWYGILKDGSTGKSTSDFNPHIFDGTEDMLKVDINSIASIKSEEDKKKEVLNYTYLMLHPTEGTEYRNQMMDSYMSNFVYNNYEKIVYGNSTSYYSSTSAKLATRNATGFLSLDSYSDNFTTAWFMSIYTKVAIVIIAIAFILIIIIGLLRGRKKSWYIIALVVVVNTLLIIPSAGEITPLIANAMVENMFKSKMTYWGVSEAVTNATLEANYVNDTSVSKQYLDSLSKDDQAQVVSLVKTLKSVYLDRALMIKTDISRKVTQTQSGNYNEIQKLRSARWMLPMIMQQFTASDSSNNYVYIPLGDIYDDVSNLYWMYDPDDAQYATTINAQQTSDSDSGVSSVATVENPISVDDRKNYYPDYKDTTLSSSSSKIPYRSEAYYRGKALIDMPHTYSYLLKGNAVPLNRQYGFGGDYTGSSSFKDFIKTSIQAGKNNSFLSTEKSLEQQAGEYDSSDRSTMRQSYGYLWATESPFNYFYESVKDSFDSDITLGNLVGKLQGSYTKLQNGTQVRTSFMHAGETGTIKDILDLQELFTNEVPYLYEMEITAGGTDGTNGVLGDSKIEDYNIYTSNYKSWLFRSNWVTKLMESPEFTKSATVKDKDGNRITIKNPMLIDCYPANRPMVFSEAQMKAQGLSEADLDIVELKAIKVNKDVSRRWTTLLNYANVKGMTKEVMLRQMATEAILDFDTEYSPSGLLNGSYEMYPTSIDLRAISFDSVMKMLMLNVTKNTSYIYSDTMQTVINDSDMLTAALLLISAFLCAYIIPLMRNVTMGLIFYLGFVSIIQALLASTKQKAKVSCGYIISNLIFLLMTVAYYLVFCVLMAVTTSDSVLTVQSVQVNVGNPVWCYAIIIVASIAYIIGMFKMMDFCFKHYRDMGMEVYAGIAGVITDNFSGGMSKLLDKLASFGNDEGSYYEGNNTSNRDRHSEYSNGESRLAGRGYNGSIDGDDTEHRNNKDDDYDSEIYSYGDDIYEDNPDGADIIDAEIRKGKEQGKNNNKENSSHNKKDYK